MPRPSKQATEDLFGGERAWNQADWTASDDRVRGGKSQSYFETSGSCGRFYGDLDINTLGGAGFASQRTTGEDRTWDLSGYDGVRLKVDRSDGKRYTLIVKDSLLPVNAENGREQATTSWEFDFDTGSSSSNESEVADAIYVPWSSFKATYRGREQKDAKPLKTSNVKRFSIMMRSFFGTQQGPFSIYIASISAYSRTDQDPHLFGGDIEKGGNGPSQVPPTQTPSSWSWRSVVVMSGATIVTLIALHTLYRRFAR